MAKDSNKKKDKSKQKGKKEGGSYEACRGGLVTGIIHILCGLACIGSGISLRNDDKKIAYEAAVSIGSIFLITGIIGVGSYWKNKCLVCLYTVCCVICGILSAAGVVAFICVLVYISAFVSVTPVIIALIVCIFEFIASLVGTVMSCGACCCACCFPAKSRDDHSVIYHHRLDGKDTP